MVERFSDNNVFLASCEQSRVTVTGWILKHRLRPKMLVITTVRVTLKISRYIKGEEKGDNQFIQQWQWGSTTTTSGWVLLRPHCVGQGSVFWRHPASRDLFPPIVTRQWEHRWSTYGQKLLLLTHHATREEGRSLTHLWSVLQTTRKTIHFSQT